MTLPSVSNLYQLPSVRRFLERLAHDLANRQSLLVVLPSGVDSTGLWDSLRTELSVREFESREVSLTELNGHGDPVVELGRALGVVWGSSGVRRTVINLMEMGKLPEVVLLENFEQLYPVEKGRWINFLGQWAEACEIQSSLGKPLTALCLVGEAEDILPCLPESKVYLSLHWWWGFPSALEAKVICRMTAQHESQGTLTRWRENVIPALVGNDTALIINLWDCLHEDLEQLMGRLRFYARERGWEQEELLDWESGHRRASVYGTASGFSLSPPPEVRILWAHGALGWTQEYGLELHTAALAMLERHEEVRHRLWRGQADLLLPLIDRCRLSLCRHMTNTYGPDWPTRWISPESREENFAVRGSPFACQWGHLVELLHHSDLRKKESHWRILSRLARNVRNDIAHYRPVMLYDFEAIMREID